MMKKYKNKTKHIYVLGPSLTHRYGIERVISDLSWYFKNKITIFTTEYKLNNTFEFDSSTKIYEIPYSTNTLLRVLYLNHIIRFIKIARIIRKDDYYIILNTHGLSSITSACLVKMLLFNKKVRISAFTYNWDELNDMRSPKNITIKKRVKSILKKLRFFLINLLIKANMVDEILVLSDTMKQSVCKLFNTNKVVVVRLGVSSFFIEKIKNKEVNIPKKIKKIIEKENVIKLIFQDVHVNREGLEDLLSALILLKKSSKTNFVLYIWGWNQTFHYDMDYLDRIQKMIKELNISDNIKFLGFLSDEELVQVYNMCDMFVFPCYQTWSLVSLEAMASKKPVIVSTDCGLSEVLNEKVAIIIPPKNSGAIKDAILKLIDNKDLREELGSNARNYVLKNLTFINTGNDLKKLWGLP